MDENGKLSDVETLLVAQAMYAKLGKVVGTKDPKSLRSQVDEAYRKQFERTGGKTFNMRFAGETVATYSVSETRPSTEQVFDLSNWYDFEEWAQSEEGYQAIMDYIVSDPQKFCEYLMKQTGEVPEGVSVRTIEKKGGGYRNGSIKNIDADRIIKMASDGVALPTNISGLLE